MKKRNNLFLHCAMFRRGMPICRVLLIGLWLVWGLTGCQSDVPGVEPPAPPSPPSVNGKIVLPHPVTLYVGVAPARIVDPSNPPAARAAGDFSRTYTDADRAAATVNSPEPPKPTNYRDPDYDQKYRDYFYWNLEGGSDWIRTLHISGLEKGVDFTVEGEIKALRTGHFDEPDYAMGSFETVVPPKEVKITLYKIPADKRLSIYVNAEYWDTVFKGNLAESYHSLNDANPYLIAVNKIALTEKSYKEIALNGVGEPTNLADYGEHYASIFSSFYTPMYGLVTHVDLDPASPLGLVGCQFGETVPKPLSFIYLERAVAMIQVNRDYEGYQNRPDGVLIDQVIMGRYVNVLSVPPSNWDNLRVMAQKWTKPTGAKAGYNYLQMFWSPNSTYSSKESLFMMQRRTYGEHFFCPENFPTRPEEQNTLRLFLTRYKNNQIDDKKDRMYKHFDVLYGERNPATGLYEIRRNTIYRLKMRVKHTPEGPVPYIVDPWQNQDIDLPW